ncbi:MAG: hypothetical protein HKN48_13130 [Flavobacteriaceae bacterium]|nr:hypothetical protein [Flavobacteriaceae bacterium]
MNTRTIYLFLFACVFLTNVGQSQELYIEGGKSITSFNFKDVLSNDLENLQSANHSYFDAGLRINLLGESFKFIGGAGIHTYGAFGSDNTQGNYLEWETTYANLHLGVDITIFTINNFSFHAKGTATPEFMLQGTQVLNNQAFNIRGEEDFDSIVVFLRGGVSFEYKVSETLGVYLQYRYGSGSQIQKSSTGGELDYASHDFGMGLLFDISKKDKE